MAAVVDPFAKPFAWSFSKLKNFETCPRRHWHCDMKRDITEEMSDAVLWGNKLHDALASAIGTDDNHLRERRDRIEQRPLAAEYARYQPWVSKLLAARAAGAKVYVEQGLAITRGFKPCWWFDREAWFRAKIDVKVVTADGRMAAAYDWKTGARKMESVQLLLSALAVMLHEPAIEAVRTEFVWFKEMKDTDPFDCIDRVSFRRNEMSAAWNSVAPRVKLIEQAFADRHYPAKPSGLCRRWCPVTTCEHNGR